MTGKKWLETNDFQFPEMTGSHSVRDFLSVIDWQSPNFRYWQSWLKTASLAVIFLSHDCEKIPTLLKGNHMRLSNLSFNILTHTIDLSLDFFLSKIHLYKHFYLHSRVHSISTICFNSRRKMTQKWNTEQLSWLNSQSLLETFTTKLTLRHIRERP